MAINCRPWGRIVLWKEGLSDIKDTQIEPKMHRLHTIVFRTYPLHVFTSKIFFWWLMYWEAERMMEACVNCSSRISVFGCWTDDWADGILVSFLCFNLFVQELQPKSPLRANLGEKCVGLCVRACVCMYPQVSKLLSSRLSYLQRKSKEKAWGPPRSDLQLCPKTLYSNVLGEGRRKESSCRLSVRKE